MSMMDQLNDEAPYYRMFATYDEVKTAVERLAAEIIAEYKGDDPLFVCLLRGAVPFASQLMLEIVRQDPEFHPELDYISVSAYGNSRRHGKPRLATGLMDEAAVAGRRVVLLDDTLDTGTTLRFCEHAFLNKGAASVDAAVLVQKNHAQNTYGDAKFAGFQINSDDWLLGMGLDDPKVGKEAHRWSSFIGVVN